MATDANTEPLTDNPQVAAQLRQLLAERANAVAYEQTTRVEAMDKQLDALGFTGDRDAKPDSKAPQGRTARPHQTTEAKGAEAKTVDTGRSDTKAEAKADTKPDAGKARQAGGGSGSGSGSGRG